MAIGQSLERGYELLEAGTLPEAAEVFEQALAEHPQDIAAHEALAWTYYEMRDYTRAASHADRRLALSPSDRTWRRSWAIIVWETRERRSEILATVRQWAELDPADRAAQHLYGKVLADSGDYDQGRQVFGTLLAGDPNDVDALTTLAAIERWDLHYAKSRDLLARAGALQPDSQTIQLDLSVMTREAQGHGVARLEPTLAITLLVILLSVLIGQLAPRLTPSLRLASLAGVAALVTASLMWLYAIPLGGSL